MALQKLAAALRKIVTPLSWWSLLLGAVGLVVMMAVVVIDVTLRSSFAISLMSSIDIVIMSLIIVVFCGIAYVELQRDHIKVTILTDTLPAFAQQVVITNGYLLSVAMAGILAWRTFAQAQFLKNTNIVFGVIDVPEWPFITIAGLFMVLFFLAVLINFLDYLGELRKTGGVKGFLWLSPGLIITTGFFVFTLRPDLLPFELTQGVWGSIVVILIFALIFLRVPIAIAMGIGSVLGISYLSSASASLTNISMSILAVASDYTWSVVPLFVWMGLLVFYAGFAKELYSTAYKWVGHLPGGLASASVGACTGLAALVGDCVTGVLTMGSLALPEMKAYNYDSKFSAAVICTAATIGILIPPSLGFIIYGMITEISIGKLFMAGIIPGILFTIILIIMITIICRINPKLGPRGPLTSWRSRLASLKDIWAVGLLVVVVLGGLYMGLFTPTEAGAIGAFGAMVIGFARRRLGVKGFVTSITEALRINSIILFIFLLAIALSHFLTVTRLPYMLAESINNFNLPPYAVLAVILLIYLFLGCIMNALPAVILTLPIFFPIVMAAGFDPILFGVLVVIMVQLGTLTPPIGVNVFAMSAIAKDVPMYGIFKAILPFWIAFLILIIILVLFPQISLFLPSLM